jgi:hypothetical protein
MPVMALIGSKRVGFYPPTRKCTGDCRAYACLKMAGSYRDITQIRLSPFTSRPLSVSQQEFGRLRFHMHQRFHSEPRIFWKNGWPTSYRNGASVFMTFGFSSRFQLFMRSSYSPFDMLGRMESHVLCMGWRMIPNQAVRQVP